LVIVSSSRSWTRNGGRSFDRTTKASTDENVVDIANFKTFHHPVRVTIGFTLGIRRHANIGVAAFLHKAQIAKQDEIVTLSNPIARTTQNQVRLIYIDIGKTARQLHVIFGSNRRVGATKGLTIRFDGPWKDLQLGTQWTIVTSIPPFGTIVKRVAVHVPKAINVLGHAIAKDTALIDCKLIKNNRARVKVTLAISSACRPTSRKALSRTSKGAMEGSAEG
jgi:hypothetical protein